MWSLLLSCPSRRHYAWKIFRDRKRSSAALLSLLCSAARRDRTRLLWRKALRQNADFRHAGIAGRETCEISATECRGYRFCHYRPCPGFLLFLSFRFLHCVLMSLTSVLKDSASAVDSAFSKPPWCVCPVLMSSPSEQLGVYGPIPRGAGSPDASPISSSLSMGTIPRDDQSALVSSDSDPDPLLNPNVNSDPDDECGATC